VWGIGFVCTHSEADYRWAYWFFVALGPLGLLAFRLWKWILTFVLLAIVGHDIHRLARANLPSQLLAAVFAGMALSNPNTRAGLAKYAQWLIKPPAGPGALSSSARVVLRVACVCGAAIYTLSVLSAYPEPHQLTHDTPIPEPVAVQSVQNIQSYSQEVPVIHSACVDSTQNNGQKEPEVRRAYPVDQSIFEESPGNWMPSETLADSNLRKAHKHQPRKK
jgi:hypothetical protein